MATQSQRNDGEVIPYNDPGIQHDHWLIRRIPADWIVEDEKIGGRRISSMAFKSSRGGISVDLQNKIEQEGLNAAQYVITPRWIGAIRFQAGQVRDLGFQVGADPTPDNPYHGQVWGVFTGVRQKELRKLAEWFVPVNNVSI